MTDELLFDLNLYILSIVCDANVEHNTIFRNERIREIKTEALISNTASWKIL